MKDDQRVALTKRMLREGLLSLLHEKELGKITVTELCARAGINRATFYRHYQQPRDVVVDIRYDLFNRAKMVGLEAWKGNDLQRWLEDMCLFFYEQADILRILFRCRTDEEFVAFINETYQTHFREMGSRGCGRQSDDGELKLTTYCVAGGMYYVLRQWILEPIEKTPQEVAGIIYRLLAMP